MVSLNVFLLGRPGSGKSTVFKLLKEELSKELKEEIIKVDDFPILKRIFEEDKDFKRRKPVPGGFKIVDESVWDEMSKELAKFVKELQSPRRIIFIEFARKNYIAALKNFDEEILKNCVVIYVRAPFEVCLERNLRRTGMDTEVHLVPEEEMRKTYTEDDHEKISGLLPLAILDNSGDIEELKTKIKTVTQKILDMWKQHEKNKIQADLV